MAIEGSEAPTHNAGKEVSRREALLRPFRGFLRGQRDQSAPSQPEEGAIIDLDTTPQHRNGSDEGLLTKILQGNVRRGPVVAGLTAAVGALGLVATSPTVRDRFFDLLGSKEATAEIPIAAEMTRLGEEFNRVYTSHKNDVNVSSGMSQDSRPFKQLSYSSIEKGFSYELTFYRERPDDKSPITEISYTRRTLVDPSTPTEIRSSQAAPIDGDESYTLRRTKYPKLTEKFGCEWDLEYVNPTQDPPPPELYVYPLNSYLQPLPSITVNFGDKRKSQFDRITPEVFKRFVTTVKDVMIASKAPQQ